MQSAVLARVLRQHVGLSLLLVVVLELELVALVHDGQVLDLEAEKTLMSTASASCGT